LTKKNITYITNQIKTEIAWSYWEGYTEVDDTLFLFVKNILYSANSFSAAEIGSENLEHLKKIVKAKVPELEYGKQKRPTHLFYIN
jgi:hypothetical protein